MTNERRPFKIENHYKHNFRDWVRDQFPDLGKYQFGEEVYPELETRLAEVHAAAMQVLDITMTHSVPVLQEYYAQDLRQLNEAFRGRDVRAYARHLDAFVGAIDVE